MKIIQSNAISVNGMIARRSGSEDWLPYAGWEEFLADASRFGNFIMGRETYERVKQLSPECDFDDVDAGFKVIVTRNPDFAQPEGYRVVHSPDEAVDFLQANGIETGLLVGGGHLNGSFYVAQLVDELWLTVNPTLLGGGRPVICDEDLEVDLELLEVINLDKNRVQLRYKVFKRLP